MQTGASISLNVFSWASPASDTAGVAAVNNTAGTLFGRSRRPRHCTAMGATAVKWAASMHPMEEVVVLLGRGVSLVVNEAAVRPGTVFMPCD